MNKLLVSLDKLYRELYHRLSYIDVAYYKYIIYVGNEYQIKEFYRKLLDLKYIT